MALLSKLCTATIAFFVSILNVTSVKSIDAPPIQPEATCDFSVSIV